MPPENPRSSDEPTARCRIEHAYDDETPPSIAIIRAISILENTDPAELSDEVEMTLYDHIDPEALDRLTNDATGAAAVTIDLGLSLETDRQYAVQVREGGRLVVQKAV